MASMTNYWADKHRRAIFRGEAYSWPTSVWAALYTTATDPDGGGVEVTGGSYARVEIPLDDDNWTAHPTIDGRVTNTLPAAFPVASADWGEVTHGALHDAPTGGNMLSQGELNEPTEVDIGQSYSFAAGQIVFTYS